MQIPQGFLVRLEQRGVAFLWFLTIFLWFSYGNSSKRLLTGFKQIFQRIPGVRTRSFSHPWLRLTLLYKYFRGEPLLLLLTCCCGCYCLLLLLLLLFLLLFLCHCSANPPIRRVSTRKFKLQFPSLEE